MLCHTKPATSPMSIFSLLVLGLQHGQEDEEEDDDDDDDDDEEEDDDDEPPKHQKYKPPARGKAGPALVNSRETVVILSATLHLSLFDRLAIRL